MDTFSTYITRTVDEIFCVPAPYWSLSIFAGKCAHLKSEVSCITYLNMGYDGVIIRMLDLRNEVLGG